MSSKVQKIYKKRVIGHELYHIIEQLKFSYDLYGYIEDDLIIHDPWFFHKVKGFVDQAGEDCILLPQRYELLPIPGQIDKLYIDGALPEADRVVWLSKPAPQLQISLPFLGRLTFESPLNPHAGCFALTRDQLEHWTKQSWWLDHDCSFITPLESAATLGLMKTFQIYKPCFSQAMWLEAQHWGTSFLGLMAQATSQRPMGSKNG